MRYEGRKGQTVPGMTSVERREGASGRFLFYFVNIFREGLLNSLENGKTPCPVLAFQYYHLQIQCCFAKLRKKCV